MKPTVGRIVWFRPAGVPPDCQPLAAIVTHVHSDTCVSLAIFAPYGDSSHKSSCELYPGFGEVPTGDYCEWMPYQLGQAKAATTA